MPQMTFTRNLNSEALIHELPDLMSREQVVLVASATDYKPNTILAKITGGADTGKWGKFDANNASNGYNVARGYLVDSRPASTGTSRAAAVVRSADLNAKKLTWDQAVAITGPQIAAAIAQLLALDTTNNYGGIRVQS